MANKKNGSDLLASRIRAVAGEARPPATPMSGPQQQAPKPGRNTRRAERKEAFKQSVLASESGERLQVVVRSISASGARVDFYAGGGAIFGHVLLIELSLG